MIIIIELLPALTKKVCTLLLYIAKAKDGSIRDVIKSCSLFKYCPTSDDLRWRKWNLQNCYTISSKKNCEIICNLFVKMIYKALRSTQTNHSNWEGNKVLFLWNFHQIKTLLTTILTNNRHRDSSVFGTMYSSKNIKC